MDPTPSETQCCGKPNMGQCHGKPNAMENPSPTIPSLTLLPMLTLSHHLLHLPTMPSLTPLTLSAFLPIQTQAHRSKFKDTPNKKNRSRGPVLMVNSLSSANSAT